MKKKTEQEDIFSQVIEWLKTHDGNMPRTIFKADGKTVKKMDEMTEEEKAEKTLYRKWYESKAKATYEKYKYGDLESIPEKYREKINTIRNLINVRPSSYDKLIEWLKTHDGQMPRSGFKKDGKLLRVSEMTDEQRAERNLIGAWYVSKTNEVMKKYRGRPIEEVPEEYREKIQLLRSLMKTRKSHKTVYQELIEWLETHNGKMPRKDVFEGNRELKVEEFTEEQKEERSLYGRWAYSQEAKMLMKYKGTLIEDIPEEYRERIAVLRSYGLGITVFDKVVEWLKTHNGRQPRSFCPKHSNRKIYLYISNV